MICFKAKIPKEVCDIDDELKLYTTVRIQFVFGYLKPESKEINLWMKQLV